MNVPDGMKVAAAILQAHGGCIHCVASIADDLDKAFPNLDWPDLVRIAAEDDPNRHYTPEHFADEVRYCITAR